MYLAHVPFPWGYGKLGPKRAHSFIYKAFNVLCARNYLGADDIAVSQTDNNPCWFAFLELAFQKVKGQ